MIPPRPTRRDALGAALLATTLAPLAGCEPQGRQPGTIVIGSSPSGVPFSFVDAWTNSLTGVMVDIAGSVAAALSLAPDFRITPFAALIPSLVAGKIDMIAAAMLRTPERARNADFSSPLYAYSGGLVVRREDRGRYPDLSSVAHRRVGAQIGTRFVDQLKAAGALDVPTYDTLSDLLRDLGHGRLDAVYGDAPILHYQLRVGPPRAVRLVTEFHAPAAESLCLILRPGDPLMPRINAAITTLRQARIPAILHHWRLDR